MQTASRALISQSISTHSLTRRLTIARILECFSHQYFNSQPHKEADGISSSLLYPSQYFNSQPHKEADHSIKNGFYRHRHFNSQPHKEADPGGFNLCCGWWYFNSQPHKEADGNRAYMPMYHAEISTHSLTRRLTLLLRETLRFYYISTHSLTRRLTHPFHSPSSCPVYFNSQPHKEADLQVAASFKDCLYFNSQPHKEADSMYEILKKRSKNFNSQPHKEADD